MSILTDDARERLASHTPAETLAQLREQLLRDQARIAATLKKRMGTGRNDMSDIDLAFQADASNSHKRGFE